MYLLYADESGTTSDPTQIFFVLAGLCIFETQGHQMAKELDKIAARFNPGEPSRVELHGSPMLNGRDFWRQFKLPDRIQAIKDSLEILAKSHPSTRVFACVVRKSLISPKDPVEFCFEQLSSRFDYYLRRLHRRNNPQRGIIIFDKSTVEATIQNLATDFKTVGHSWDIIRNLAELPLFIDSRASRLIQLADLVAYSVFRNYERKDPQFFSIFTNRLDRSEGQIHGLFEKV
jgi:Protein of unknown function (DUF3800)